MSIMSMSFNVSNEQYMQLKMNNNFKRVHKVSITGTTLKSKIGLMDEKSLQTELRLQLRQLRFQRKIFG